MTNTEISYMYRDAGNWKQFNTVVLLGKMSPENIELIFAILEDGNLFIPEQVGLEKLQDRWDKLYSDIDHVWHELNRDDIEIVDDLPTIDLTAQELVENFRRIKTNKGWYIARSDWLMWYHNDSNDENNEKK